MARTHSSMSIETIQKIFHADIGQDVNKNGNLTDKEKLLELLNEAYVSAIIGMLRYRRHYFLAQRFNMKKIADSFMYYSNDEQEHADWLANRIVQLSGLPDFSLRSVVDASSQTYAVDESLMDMLIENLLVSRLAITNYRDLIKFLGNQDPISSVMLNIILLDEEEHAEALEEFIESASTQH